MQKYGLSKYVEELLKPAGEPEMNFRITRNEIIRKLKRLPQTVNTNGPRKTLRIR